MSSISGSRSETLQDIAPRLWEALISTSMGLLVSLVAAFSHKYLLGRMEIFDTEMENVSVDLVNSLLPYIGRLQIPIEKQFSAFVYECGPDLVEGRPGERNRLIGLVWPRLGAILDADVVLRDGRTVSLLYGIIAGLLYWSATSR